MGASVFGLCFGMHYFAIILTRKRGLASELEFSFCYPVTVFVLQLFRAVPLFGLQCVIVVFPDHTYFFMKAFSYHGNIMYYSLFLNY